MASARKIMLIRHAEKPAGTIQGVDINGNGAKDCLVVQVWQRAGALARFFAPVNGQFQNPQIGRPQFLFASSPVKDSQSGGGSKSFRPAQTVMPLSQLLGSTVPLNLMFTKGDETQVATAAISCAGVVLIAWQREGIPVIAETILGKSGIVPSKWPANRFDMVWVFDLQPGGTYSFSQAPQMLLAGDLAAPIA